MEATNRITPPTVLIISATDSGGCAGMQADLRVCASLRVFAVCAVTAVTAQNSLGVKEVLPMPGELVRQQIQCAVEQQKPQAVKIGLLPDVSVMRSVFETLSELGVSNIIFDPVMAATAGKLIEDDRQKWIDTLLGYLSNITLLTPNLPELEMLGRKSLEKPEEIDNAVKQLLRLYGAKGVLVKGGHGIAANKCVDKLFSAGRNDVLTLTSEEIHTCNLRGTGCSLSTAIACYMALGCGLEEAEEKAHKYLQKAILSGKRYCYDAGSGPVDHFVNL